MHVLHDVKYILAQAGWLGKSICARLKLIDVPGHSVNSSAIGESQKKQQEHTAR